MYKTGDIVRLRDGVLPEFGGQRCSIVKLGPKDDTESWSWCIPVDGTPYPGAPRWFAHSSWIVGHELFLQVVWEEKHGKNAKEIDDVLEAQEPR